MAFRFFIVLYILSLPSCFSQTQDTISIQNTKVKDTLVVQNTAIPDTISGPTVVLKSAVVEDNTYTQKTIEATVDSTSIANLKDNEEVLKLDQAWFDELYSNRLFDTIYKTVTELDYKPVDYPELHSDTLKARLKELDARTPFNVEYNPSLESVIKSYLKHRRNSIQNLLTLSAFYFPMFEGELDKHNIPLEIKYLAIVESALKPRARSRVGATGLWQFMYGTGKEYGLDVSSYVDERSDPIKSTEAAAKYLSRLYKIFGDWDLALAAYNSGPGNVGKAIRRSGGYRNYWNIRHNLPRETAGYLPAFLANMYIFEYAKEHGFKNYKPELAYFETDTVLVKQQITLDQVSEATGTPIEELQFLNPSYKLDIIPFIKDENYVLRLPRDVVGTFVNNEDRIYAFAKAELDKREKQMPQFIEAQNKTTYRVKSGDYLGKISRLYGVRVSDIKKWNGLRSNNLKIGQRLTIFPRTPHGNATSSAKATVKTIPIKGDVINYTVKDGDSLWSISQKFSGVSVQNIKDWNGISGSKLKPGMILKIAKS
ncbi:LysM peptidoglycan-binding domain-containing protein [Algibacter amylolyticus]|uniref:LysM peptidoglycan-binding domain-containing protein n=1 Tax=Algibacter amylolyticus TaxID=1608400 RepID=A0A5M7BD52_9FLAO|nr:LysM peptidoglycan-binding domain-containing protein [Algibacter amylolyticus]KAA5827432.1 LysM peptidoglycan-binding domain-containing protein [Algibacter amylolyticus]MBB5266624.1 membrane-bound lytic murein transglycosylase D [Algibacter amylolyticus]TSJ81677.1 LysM peptidoglycan-binding domain-containing protein [Algibacter amylolyticus]